MQPKPCPCCADPATRAIADSWRAAGLAFADAYNNANAAPTYARPPAPPRPPRLDPTHCTCGKDGSTWTGPHADYCPRA